MITGAVFESLEIVLDSSEMDEIPGPAKHYEEWSQRHPTMARMFVLWIVAPGLGSCCSTLSQLHLFHYVAWTERWIQEIFALLLRQQVSHSIQDYLEQVAEMLDPSTQA